MNTRHPPQRELRLLMVEDCEDDAFLVTEQLRHEGWRLDARRVDSAEDLRAALAESHWDVVLSDQDMPGFDARQALAIVREDDDLMTFLIV